LNDPNLVIETFHETEGDLVIRLAITDDAVPMAFDQPGKLPVRFQPTPLELGFPVLEELARPSGITVIPELPKRFLEHIRFVQTFVGLEQQIQGSPPVQIEIGPPRQERITMSLDETPVFCGNSGVFLPPDIVHRLGQVLQDMEFIKDDFSVWRVALERVPKRFPHVHDRQAQRTIPLESHIGEEPVHVFFRTTELSAHPDRALLVKVRNHDGIVVALADGDFINADGPQAAGRQVFRPEIFHVGDIHPPHLVPIKVVELGRLLDRHRPAEPADGLFETLGETPGFGQPGKGFLFHAPTSPALHPPILEFQVDPRSAGVQVPNPMNPAVIETSGGRPA
jgi:hypothetical protein